jgi:hypothetical protein
MEGLVATVGVDLSPGGGGGSRKIRGGGRMRSAGGGVRGWGGLVEGGGEAW